MDDTLARLRLALGWLLVAGMAGVGLELVLGEHYEEWRQWAPLALLGAALPVAVAALRQPARGALRLLRGLMGLFVLSGGVGIVLHLRGKMEFVLEREPDLRGVALLVASLAGSSPPILAPGAMSALGVLGLLWAWRHPALAPSSSPLPESSR